MDNESPQNDITKKAVVYTLPGMDAVEVRKDIEYQASEENPPTFDLYSPPDSPSGARKPAVILVSGYPDPGYERMLGCKQKEMASNVSWAQLLAASGLMTVTYTNEDPARDLDVLLDNLRQNGSTLGIDENRIGVWACSGNVPMALAALMQGADPPFKCAALCYGFMLDLAGSTVVAETAAQFGFVNPAGATSLDLPQDLPLLVVRAGQDEMPRLNETIELFMSEALAHNLPVTLVNHHSAPHAFDIHDDSERSHEVIRQILAFLRLHLLAKDALA